MTKWRLMKMILAGGLMSAAGTFIGAWLGYDRNGELIISALYAVSTCLLIGMYYESHPVRSKPSAKREAPASQPSHAERRSWLQYYWRLSIIAIIGFQTAVPSELIGARLGFGRIGQFIIGMVFILVLSAFIALYQYRKVRLEQTSASKTVEWENEKIERS
ncbi:MAG: hypothetical protein ACP5SH_17150 [Syntrophobacteraceae bacterium]